MPALNNLSCSIELGVTNTRVCEHRVIYSDQRVECHVCIPDNHTEFSIHLSSCDYVGPGLAAFVFIDGQYQCNRFKTGLPFPEDALHTGDEDIDFRFRQKEEVMFGRTHFVGRSWTFAPLNHGESNSHKLVNPDFLTNLGKIEVIALRCRDARASRPTASLIDISQSKTRKHDVEQLAGASKPHVAKSPEQVKAPRAASVAPSSSVHFPGLFDGASDAPDGITPDKFASHGLGPAKTSRAAPKSIHYHLHTSKSAKSDVSSRQRGSIGKAASNSGSKVPDPIEPWESVSQKGDNDDKKSVSKAGSMHWTTPAASETKRTKSANSHSQSRAGTTRVAGKMEWEEAKPSEASENKRDKEKPHGSRSSISQHNGSRVNERITVTTQTAHWQKWTTEHTGYGPTPADGSMQPDLCESAYTYPEYELPKVSRDFAKAKGISEQVKTGPGALYWHKVGSPTYIDSFDSPYAVFTFNYRTSEELSEVLGKRVEPDGEDTRVKYQAMSRAELVRELESGRTRKASTVSDKHSSTSTAKASKAGSDWDKASKSKNVVSGADNWGTNDKEGKGYVRSGDVTW